MSLLRNGKAQALTLYLGESDQWQGQPLYAAIVRFLREQGCAGATVTRAIAGYGAGARLHEQGEGLRWSSDAPVVIQVIDQPDRLRRLLPQLQDMLGNGLITLHEVEVLKYTHARSRGVPTKLPVARIMETAIITVELETPVATVITLLLHAPFRALPVIDGQRHLHGIISTGDLIDADLLPVRRGVLRTALELGHTTAEALAPPLAEAQRSNLCAQDIMNRNVRTLTLEASVREAARIMLETGLKRLPVISADGILQGMLSRSDLLQAIVTSPLMSSQARSATSPLGRTKPLTTLPVQQQPIADYMETTVATVEEETPFAEAIDALMLSPQKRVIVLDAERHVQGIISDIDVLSRIQEEARPGLLKLFTNWTRGRQGHVPTGALRTPAGKIRNAADIMNREVATITETTSVQETISRMMATRRKVLPVVDAQHRLQGVVARSDLLQILLAEG